MILFCVHFVPRIRNKRKRINGYGRGIIYSPIVTHLLHAYLLLDGCQFIFASKFHEKIHSYIYIGTSKSHSIMTARTNLYDMRFNITLLLKRIDFYINIHIFYFRKIRRANDFLVLKAIKSHFLIRRTANDFRIIAKNRWNTLLSIYLILVMRLFTSIDG